MGSLRLLAALALCGAAAFGAGCATCKPDRPLVDPRVGGGVSIGSGGVTPTGGVSLDVSNLFCRQPDPSTQPQPGPADEPIRDLPPAQERPGGGEG